ncbi:hypothetical protein ACFX13_019765 [Malus domestica]
MLVTLRPEREGIEQAEPWRAGGRGRPLGLGGRDPTRQRKELDLDLAFGLGYNNERSQNCNLGLGVGRSCLDSMVSRLAKNRRRLDEEKTLVHCSVCEFFLHTYIHTAKNYGAPIKFRP